jgi:predicted molibdopterin-dependent oxidoreductase YjgC
VRVEPLLRPDARALRVEIDHLAVTVPEGTTVLRAAEVAGVSVPSLCSHKELSPFGGCRLCTVEIEGVRGYPLACSTLAQDGMEVTTDTVALREMHAEILRLILSEHPSSCLLCDEADDCRRSLTTIRKAGVSTGCRSCSNDGACELQGLVERLGITEIGYPIAYRGLEAEHDDPFFDRDYNLCILCGRCVRMCQEVRGASVLAFKYRGPRTLIGPAFGASHMAAGCEFCGACVSVCPTGALADKVSKWDGRPDGIETSTCPFCCLGCRVELAHRDGALSSVGAAHDAEVNDGQLCVRGRFCAPEATHHHSRARRPLLRKGAYFRVASWDEALDEMAARLSGVVADDILMLVSGDLTNEGLYAAQRFARGFPGGAGLDSTARARLPGGPVFWSRLFALPISIKALGEAEIVIVAGLDTRFSFSVAGVQVRRAVRRGAKLIVVDARESNLARIADQWLRPRPGDEARALVELLRRLGDGEPGETARGAATTAVVIGPRVFDCRGAEELPSELEALAARRAVSVLPLAHGANIRGALELGVLGEVLPGPRLAAGRGSGLAAGRGSDVAAGPGHGLTQLRAGRLPKVLYLVGAAPFASRPDCDVVIAQDLYLPPFEVDAFLPATSFAEAEGTLTNIEGRVQDLRRVEHLPPGIAHGLARPDWQIFSDLAARLGRCDLQYADAAAVRAAIRVDVPGFAAERDRSSRRMTPIASGGSPTASAFVSDGGRVENARRPAGRGSSADSQEGPAGRGRFVLISEEASFCHRGIDLADVVEGLGELHLEEGLAMNPDDLARLGVGEGGTVTVTLDGGDLVCAVRSDLECPRGAAFVTRDETWKWSTHPVRVRIRAGDRSRAGASRSSAGAGRSPAGASRSWADTGRSPATRDRRLAGRRGGG